MRVVRGVPMMTMRGLRGNALWIIRRNDERLARRRSKFDPYWNELVVAGYRDGKVPISLPPPAPPPLWESPLPPV